MRVIPTINGAARNLVRCYDTMRIGRMNFGRKPPILVLTSGKVGSSSVYYSLKRRGLPVFHLHSLDSTVLRQKIEGTSPEHLSRHLGIGVAVARQIDRHPTIRWNVITMVREPIGALVSGVCQNHRRYGMVNPNGDLDVDAALGWLEEKADDGAIWTYPEKWFDNEIEKRFGIRVFDQPFDPDQGYQILENERAKVLVIRMEDLDRCFGPAASKLLDLPDQVRLVRANTGANKSYADAYRELKQRFRLPPIAAKDCLDSAMIRHFYPDRIEKIRDRWA